MRVSYRTTVGDIEVTVEAEYVPAGIEVAEAWITAVRLCGLDVTYLTALNRDRWNKLRLDCQDMCEIQLRLAAGPVEFYTERSAV